MGIPSVAKLLEGHNRADRLAGVHELERVVDLFQRHGVRDQIADVDLVVHVPVDDLRDVGAAARAAERGAPPDPSGDELERTRLDLLAGPGDADDRGDAPAPVAALERLAHELDVADALEAVVGAALGDLDQVADQVPFAPVGIYEVGRAELPRYRFARRVDVDRDDLGCSDQPGCLDDIEADSAQSEDDDPGSRLNLGREDHRADAGGDAAADVADLVERRVLAYLRHPELGKHRVVRERRTAHVVLHRLPVQAEAARAVGHHALPLRGADGGAEVGLAREAVLALPAFRDVQRNDVVSCAYGSDAGAHLGDDRAALVAEDRREEPFGI